jgi:hypothetical protein
LYAVGVLGGKAEGGHVVRVGERIQLDYPPGFKFLPEIGVDCFGEFLGYRVVWSLDFDLQGTFITYSDAEPCDVSQELWECRVRIVAKLMEDAMGLERDGREEGGVTRRDEVVKRGGIGA